MRVLLVSPYDLEVPGGVQSHVRLLGERLVEGGDRVVLLGPGAPGTHREDSGLGVVGVGRSRGVPFNGSVAPVALSPAAARRTREAVRRLRPDLVHVHEPLVPVVGPAAVLASPVPVVSTLHAWSAQDAAYRTVAPVARRIVGRSAALVAVSPAARAYHAAALGVPPDRFRVLPNGVDVARFVAAREAAGVASRSGAPPRLVFVGRLEPRKGALVLARAFLRLLATHPDAQLTVVGDGPERASLEALLSRPATGQVELAGRVTGAELARLLAAADVAVAPALGGESFGIVLLEAMAAGTAVVASDIPGYAGVVTDGVDGLLFPPGDDAALAATLARVLDDSAARDRLVAAGTTTAARHDWSVVTARIREVYLEVLGARDR